MRKDSKQGRDHHATIQPGNVEYELCGNATVEWYDCTGNMSDPDYHSAIWIPVKRK